ncbi:MAG: hypothetical protein II838_04360 [Lachnospiraceae bacterium]|nr:hypothetical protein [Lachnospiraceae bacterium]
MIAGLDTSGAISALYPSYQKKKVSRDTPTASGIREDKDEEENTLETSLLAAMQEQISEELEETGSITYASDNPYVSAQKTIDKSLILGMNVDEKA